MGIERDISQSSKIIESIIELGKQGKMSSKAAITAAKDIRSSIKFRFAGQYIPTVNREQMQGYVGTMELPYNMCLFEFPSYAPRMQLAVFLRKIEQMKGYFFFQIFIKSNGAWGVFATDTNYCMAISRLDGGIVSLSDDKHIRAEFEKAISIKSEALDVLRGVTGIAVRALTMLSCKNIVQTCHTPPAKLNKKRLKKGKEPLYTYHTLDVILPGRRRMTEPGDPTGRTTRLHLCRGHFKEYTKEKPLFGCHVGRYWWQPMARGDKTKGIVMKDYNVKVEKGGTHGNVSKIKCERISKANESAGPGSGAVCHRPGNQRYPVSGTQAADQKVETRAEIQ